MTTAPALHGKRRKLPRDRRTRAEKSQIDILKGINAQSLGGDLLAAEFVRLARGSRRGEQLDGDGRKVPPFHHVKHFDTHGASCANDCNSILSGHKGESIYE